MRFKLDIDMNGQDFDIKPELKIKDTLDRITIELADGVTNGFIYNSEREMIGYFEISI